MGTNPVLTPVYPEKDLRLSGKATTASITDPNNHRGNALGIYRDPSNVPMISPKELKTFKTNADAIRYFSGCAKKEIDNLIKAGKDSTDFNPQDFTYFLARKQLGFNLGDCIGNESAAFNLAALKSKAEEVRQVEANKTGKKVVPVTQSISGETIVKAYFQEANRLISQLPEDPIARGAALKTIGLEKKPYPTVIEVVDALSAQTGLGKTLRDISKNHGKDSYTIGETGIPALSKAVNNAINKGTLATAVDRPREPESKFNTVQQQTTWSTQYHTSQAASQRNANTVQRQPIAAVTLPATAQVTSKDLQAMYTRAARDILAIEEITKPSVNQICEKIELLERQTKFQKRTGTPLNGVNYAYDRNKYNIDAIQRDLQKIVTNESIASDTRIANRVSSGHLIARYQSAAKQILAQQGIVEPKKGSRRAAFDNYYDLLSDKVTDLAHKTNFEKYTGSPFCYTTKYGVWDRQTHHIDKVESKLQSVLNRELHAAARARNVRSK